MSRPPPTNSTSEIAGGPLKSVAIIDFTHLAVQTGGDPALQCEILRLFVDQTGEILAVLRDPTTMPPTVADLTHRLKGSAQAIGAFALAEAAEASLRTPGQTEALDSLFAAAESALVAVRRHLAAVPESSV